MAIKRNLLAQNVVLVSNSINVNSFSQYWFIKNGIFKEEEFISSVFTSGLVSVTAPDCQITVLPNQIQFELKNDDEVLAERTLKERMGMFINHLANINVIAIGVNFIWKVIDDEYDIPHFSKILFGVSESKIRTFFNHVDTRYGVYFSQNIDEDTRLKLDIKPTLVKENGNDVEMMMYNFNFHCQVIENDMDATLLRQLDKWQKFRHISKDLVCL